MVTSKPERGPGKVLLVDDDQALGRSLVRALSSRGGFDVTYETDPAAAIRAVQAGQWDLLITDIEMPGMSGLELIRRVREADASLPVAVMTGHATVDRVVTALRESAGEFLQKPVDLGVFVATATTLVERGRRAREASREVVLAVGAHPDDVEIGAAGTLLAHRAAGDRVAILTLSRGAVGGDQARRAAEAGKAAEVIGAELFLADLEDTALSEGNPTIAVIDDVITQVRPTIVYTHSANDVHQDHRNTHRAVMVAARRVAGVFCFQSPSATVDFRPTHFVPIDGYVDGKVQAIRAFDSQFAIRDYMEPDLIASTARYWSRFCSARYAEAFETVRARAGVRATVPTQRGLPMPVPLTGT